MIIFWGPVGKRLEFRVLNRVSGQRVMTIGLGGELGARDTVKRAERAAPAAVILWTSGCGQRWVVVGELWSAILREGVHVDSGIGEPGQSRVSEVVAAQMPVAEPGDHVVPVCGVARDGGGVVSASRAREQGVSGRGAVDRMRRATRGRICPTRGTSRARLP
ncbi:hypothetical protein ACIPJM_18225 [Streptomyces halstedii]|uniref:hypothetical protein n=1 Tax=Streptomyces halstedii TaxID=1944 RepID=UPI00382EC13F